MVDLDDFEGIHYLGKGSHGKVIQSRKKYGDNINKIYAIKTVLLKYKGSAIERSILTRIKHPMVVELFYTFEAEERIFLVLEYLCGGTLSSVLNDNNGAIPEQDASFYVKEVIVALEYLHSEGILYKDLKQSNILLDIHGHIKLIDFGLSEENFTQDTLSFISCGTPYYKAPEMMNDTGYGFAVDWWSLGILFYRMVTGNYPFGGTDEAMLKKAILSGRYIYLPKKFSNNAKHLLARLLQVNPEDRLGSTDGAGAVKNHPYFANTSWENVLQRIETPPFVPKVENANDISRFRILRKHGSISDGSDSESSSKSSNLSACVSSQKRIKLELKSSKESPSTSTAPITTPVTASQETAPPETTPPETAPPTL